MNETIPAGTLVLNTRKPEWGPGKVVKCENDSIWVFWRDAGDGSAKKMVRSVAALEIAKSQEDAILDNLPPLLGKDGAVAKLPNWMPFDAAVKKFLDRFPLGFYDPEYIGVGGSHASGERQYKVDAHKVVVGKFGNGRFRSLLETAPNELQKELHACVRAINLVSPYEKAAFTDAIQDGTAAKRMLYALADVMESATPEQRAFESYFQSICDLPAERGRVATWPIATIIPFLYNPESNLFLKPEVTHRAAEAMGFNLNYSATPNWLTYSRLIEMGRVYASRLAALKPRDMIDVQSFFWVVGAYD